MDQRREEDPRAVGSHIDRKFREKQKRLFGGGSQNRDWYRLAESRNAFPGVMEIFNVLIWVVLSKEFTPGEIS